ncbi:SPOR domain-containing protein [Rubricoccus marinus]|uniref:SPOR domain-containing protein n=1 Tax=Rubricoccus marinus TaxID=716817 RepID=A0A259TXJ4_9BACT|nr:SPOR domain-containing protein [Rubricoccus marinus]OZC02294.1 hypothetical protein BSZ36_04455 [Rubricoccus marinus]
MTTFAGRTLRSLALLALLPVLAACSGSGPIADGGDGPDAGPEAPVAGFPSYETFDPSAYNAEPPPRVTIEHDVPARTMEGTVQLPGTVAAPTNEGQPREVEGFRIHIGRSEDRQSAERIRDAAAAWWRDARNRPGAPRNLEIVVAYVQPYYRVRVGAFEFQEDADDALEFVRRQYGNAFIVPDRVTVR